MTRLSHMGDQPERMKSRGTIDAMSQLLTSVFTSDTTPRDLLQTPAEVYYARGIHDALCWVLGHTHRNNMIPLVERIEMELAAVNVFPSGHFTRKAEEEAERDRRRNALVAPLAALVRERRLSLEEAVRRNKEAAELGFYDALKSLPAGVCRVCGCKHPDGNPHDPTSELFRLYTVWQTGRLPLWSDALAHCDDKRQAAAVVALNRLGHYPEVQPITPAVAEAVRRAFA